MKIFITGTGTDVGKTLICSWIGVHTGYAYFKPVQTGWIYGKDSEVFQQITNNKVLSEVYNYLDPVSPHLAAKIENDNINLQNLQLPDENNLIVEGAGGVLVPLNENSLMVDLIKQFDLPVILVSRTELGTINHTLLSLEALRLRGIKVLGVIMNGNINCENSQAIEFYGKTNILAEFPQLASVTYDSLKAIIFPEKLKQIFKN